ncbi:MAG: hypothetical protein A2261_01780 [Candidatus Magasanikbacteria bacterium RIFOXYA2_FULL_44_8]|uniref:Response regulatory domain-containing protein n=1 Tax=Candidatus Magasanikbacteria bacterium RIFOXYA2_FULL_44_8 TaxID=1798696 RepID=A0A1F6NKY0_9BACT|nr:MAG: hypothetical protein A2261_01780 [Candidatus Magasanikbacteria bacterium RIFOXYA2_FULL_44_8]
MKALIIAPNQAKANELVRALQSAGLNMPGDNFIPTETIPLSEITARVNRSDANILLITTDVEPTKASGIVERLHYKAKRPRIFAVGSVTDTSPLQSRIHYGTDEEISFPLNSDGIARLKAAGLF